MAPLPKCTNSNGCLFEILSNCVYYNGPYLPNLNVLNKENLTSILGKIDAFISGGSGIPTLQVVSQAGNTTNQALIITGQGGAIMTGRGLQLSYSNSGGLIQAYGVSNDLLPITLKGSHITSLSTVSGLPAVNSDDYITLSQLSASDLADFDNEYFDI